MERLTTIQVMQSMDEEVAVACLKAAKGDKDLRQRNNPNTIPVVSKAAGSMEVAS
jgi:hypothetical protein